MLYLRLKYRQIMSDKNSKIEVDKIVKHWIEKMKNIRTWIKEML